MRRNPLVILRARKSFTSVGRIKGFMPSRLWSAVQPSHHRTGRATATAITRYRTNAYSKVDACIQAEAEQVAEQMAVCDPAKRGELGRHSHGRDSAALIPLPVSEIEQTIATHQTAQRKTELLA
jgi:hypothetical protein